MENDKCPQPEWELDWWSYWNERGFYKEDIMEKEDRQQQSQDTKHEHWLNHLANLRIFHGWLGHKFFNHGVVRKPVDQSWREKRMMRRIVQDGKNR